LFKDDKILQIGEMTIANPTVIAIVPEKLEWICFYKHKKWSCV